MENNWRNDSTGGSGSWSNPQKYTGYGYPYPQEGTAPAVEPIDYRKKLAEAVGAYNPEKAQQVLEQRIKKAQDAQQQAMNNLATQQAESQAIPYRYPNGGALTPDRQAPRTFGTGATRNSDAGKPDYEGFMSPIVMHRFGQYMSKHRRMEDGSLRESDNWQKGIPRKQYLKSMLRHVMDVWLIMRDKAEWAVERSLEEALCAVKFNVDGLLHEVLTGRDGGDSEAARIRAAHQYPVSNQAGGIGGSLAGNIGTTDMLLKGVGGLGAGW